MKVFLHHIYEYEKGLRNLVLYTADANCRKLMERKLKKRDISYVIYPLGKARVNVFFGHTSCVNVVRRMGCDNLSELSPANDFMLGIMLGYDRVKQCDRYLDRLNSSENKIAGNRSKHAVIACKEGRMFSRIL